MRITDNLRTANLVRANAVTSRVLEQKARIASAGARVQKPSDDPVAYGTIVARSSAISAAQVRARTARESSDSLSVAERALDASASLVDEAASIAVQGSNESLSPADRDALAARVHAIRAQVLEQANTKGPTGYLFGGTKTDTAPFDSAGAFGGNDGIVRAPIGTGVRINASGARAFTAAGGRDVLGDLAALETALSTGSLADVRSSIDLMRTGHEQIVQAQVDVGLSMERLGSAADVLESSSIALESSRARAAGSDDLAAMATELSAASTAYQRSLEATRHLLALPSLADS